MHIYMHVKYKKIVIKSSWPVAQEEQALFDGIWGSTGWLFLENGPFIWCPEIRPPTMENSPEYYLAGNRLKSCGQPNEELPQVLAGFLFHLLGWQLLHDFTIYLLYFIIYSHTHSDNQISPRKLCSLRSPGSWRKQKKEDFRVWLEWNS